jgi:hypothetical protein
MSDCEHEFKDVYVDGFTIGVSYCDLCDRTPEEIKLEIRLKASESKVAELEKAFDKITRFACLADNSMFSNEMSQICDKVGYDMYMEDWKEANADE